MTAFSERVTLHSASSVNQIQFSYENYNTVLRGDFERTHDGILSRKINEIEMLSHVLPRQITPIYNSNGDPVIFVHETTVLSFDTYEIALALQDYVHALALNTPGHEGYNPTQARAYG
ncbi:MAG: hypothetical protein AAF755_07085 [Pseudomonadota bacterium]